MNKRIVWLTDMRVFEGREWFNLPEHIRKYCGKDGVIECPVGMFQDIRSITGEMEDMLIIPYGSIQFNNRVTMAFSKDNYIFNADNSLFKPSHAMSLSNIDDFLNNDAEIITWGILKQVYQDNTEYFVKPDTGNKTWTGHVWNTEYDSPRIMENTFSLMDIDQLIIAKPKEIDEEYRIFVCNGEVIDLSQYSYDDIKLLGAFKDVAKQFAEEWVDNNHFEVNTYMMDVAVTDGIAKIVEFNSINSSGLYGIDMDKFVENITEDVINTADAWGLLD